MITILFFSCQSTRSSKLRLRDNIIAERGDLFDEITSLLHTDKFGEIESKVEAFLNVAYSPDQMATILEQLPEGVIGRNFLSIILSNKNISSGVDNLSDDIRERYILKGIKIEDVLSLATAGAINTVVEALDRDSVQSSSENIDPAFDLLNFNVGNIEIGKTTILHEVVKYLSRLSDLEIARLNGAIRALVNRGKPEDFRDIRDEAGHSVETLAWELGVIGFLDLLYIRKQIANPEGEFPLPVKLDIDGNVEEYLTHIVARLDEEVVTFFFALNDRRGFEKINNNLFTLKNANDETPLHIAARNLNLPFFKGLKEIDLLSQSNRYLVYALDGLDNNLMHNLAQASIGANGIDAANFALILELLTYVLRADFHHNQATNPELSEFRREVYRDLIKKFPMHRFNKNDLRPIDLSYRMLIPDNWREENNRHPFFWYFLLNAYYNDMLDVEGAKPTLDIFTFDSDQRHRNMVLNSLTGIARVKLSEFSRRVEHNGDVVYSNFSVAAPDFSSTNDEGDNVLNLAARSNIGREGFINLINALINFNVNSSLRDILLGEDGDNDLEDDSIRRAAVDVLINNKDETDLQKEVRRYYTRLINNRGRAVLADAMRYNEDYVRPLVDMFRFVIDWDRKIESLGDVTVVEYAKENLSSDLATVIVAVADANRDVVSPDKPEWADFFSDEVDKELNITVG